ncbi:hypothetical protein K2X33_07285, partial [bacterium]|nr:hypothetical protein [bacterium]
LRAGIVVGGLFLGLGGCGAKPGVPSNPAQTNLLKAVADGDVEAAQRAIRAGASPNEHFGPVDARVSPLMAALAQRNEKMALMLLEQGARPQTSYQRYSARDLSLKLFGHGSRVHNAIVAQEAKP